MVTVVIIFSLDYALKNNLRLLKRIIFTNLFQLSTKLNNLLAPLCHFSSSVARATFENLVLSIHGIRRSQSDHEIGLHYVDIILIISCIGDLPRNESKRKSWLLICCDYSVSGMISAIDLSFLTNVRA